MAFTTKSGKQNTRATPKFQKRGIYDAPPKSGHDASSGSLLEANINHVQQLGKAGSSGPPMGGKLC